VTVTSEERVLTLAELEERRPLVEALIGRELREAERLMDAFALDEALNTAKDDLERAVEAEKRRAINRRVRRREPLALEVTARILEPLERLHRLGRREAAAELERAGYEAIVRAYAVDPKYTELELLAAFLEGGLRRLGVRIENELVLAELGGVVEQALIRKLARIPGARGLAASVVSGALTSGLAATFEQNEHLIAGWEYTAVLDGGTCERCGPLDGTTYDSLAELYRVLPTFGPNPSCLGGGRCRCRAVPLRDTRP